MSSCCILRPHPPVTCEECLDGGTPNCEQNDRRPMDRGRAAAALLALAACVACSSAVLAKTCYEKRSQAISSGVMTCTLESNERVATTPKLTMLSVTLITALSPIYRLSNYAQLNAYAKRLFMTMTDREARRFAANILSSSPTASDHTALDIHEGPTEGCYYNFQHYGEGDRIMTNEPCLNCTCHNRMLMCYLRVCPFTKAIGQDCTVEKRADQCCPIVTCPDVPVDLLTSTSTSSPAEYGPTGMGKLDKYGCSINGKYFPEGSKVPPSPNKPCEHCYCIRNMTTCVMQECTLHVDGCTPIYHKDVCCPVRYSCDHTEDEIPLLDDMTTTVRPTPGFLLTTTTMMPVTQMTQDCIHDEQIFPDGASIKTDKACEHCYCMKGDIVCVVQECGTPMENEGKNCTSLPPRHGQCCPDTYICEGDEPSLDITTEVANLTSAPPRRVGVEGSGYRNEPDELYTERGPFENEVEGSGDTSEADMPSKISPDPRDELLLSTTEKEVYLSQTTEADKGFNTIPDTISENEPIVTIDQDSYAPSTESTITDVKATADEKLEPSQDVTRMEEDEKFTTETSFHSHEIDEIIPTEISKQEETPTYIPESTTLKEETLENSATETTELKKETEQIPISTESVSLKEIVTTENIVISVTEKDTSEAETSSDSKIYKEPELTTNIVSSVTEQNEPNVEMSTLKEMNIVKDMTTVSDIKEIPETTSINPVDNEVDYIPARIPGEGCRCVSSIIKCDPIICSPPPEYMENMNDCQTSYDTPDACCPTYVCNAKETSLPQSHSQTSVTESSKPAVADECNGSECNFNGEKQPTHTICESGNCESGSKQSDCGSNGCQDQPLPSQLPEDCFGEKCSVSPITPCEGENCETSAKTEEDINNVSPSKPICTNEHGCETTPTEEKCNEESCRRKESSETETNVPVECSGSDCQISNEQNVAVVELPNAPSTDRILNEKTTETIISELVTQNILTSEKEIISESSTELSPELPPTKTYPSESSSSKTTEETTEVPIKSVTDIESNMSTDVDMQNQMDILKEKTDKSETSPIDFEPTSSGATENIHILDEQSSTEKVSETKPTNVEEIEAVTESSLKDDTVINKDVSPQDYTTETVQTSTAQPTVLDTEQDETFTKLPKGKDDDIEQHVTQAPKEIEVKLTTEIEYQQSTTEKQEKVDILSQTTLIQESMTTELPEPSITVSDTGDVSKTMAGSEDDTTEHIQYDKTEKISSPGVDTTDSPMPSKTEQQATEIESVTSESSTVYDKDFTVKHDTYTELPQITITNLDTKVDSDSLQTTTLEESEKKDEELSTPSSVTKDSEQLATNTDLIHPEDEHSETKYQEYPSSTESELLKHEDRNEDLNKEVTEKQITETKHEIPSEPTQEDSGTTKLDISTEAIVEKDMEPIGDLQTISPITNKESTINLVKDAPVTESSHYDTSDSETESVDKYSESNTTPPDVSVIKETPVVPVVSEVSDNESYETDKNVIKLTSPSSDESSTIENTQYSDVEKGEEPTTSLPKEITEESYPTIDINSHTPIKTDDMKQESPEHQIPEKSVDRDDEAMATITTTLPPFTNDITYDVPSSQSPNDVTSDEVRVTSSSNKDEKDETETTITSSDEHVSEKTEHSVQEFTSTTLNNDQISEVITEKIHTEPQEYVTEKSKDEESSSEKPNEDINKDENAFDGSKKDHSTELPYFQTTSVNLEGYSTVSRRQNEVYKTTNMPESDSSDIEKSVTTFNPLITEGEEVTEKIINTDMADQESSTEISKDEILDDKHIQPTTENSAEVQTEHDISLNGFTKDKELENEELLTSVNYMSSTQSKVTSQFDEATEISVTPKAEVESDQKEEKISTEEPKQSTQFENEDSIQDEHHTISSLSKEPSYTESPVEIDISHSNSDNEIDSNVGTTEPVKLKEEDLPIPQDVSSKETYTITDENQTVPTKLVSEEKVVTTEVAPTEQEKLSTYSEMDIKEGEKDTSEVTKSPEIMNFESDKYLTTESLQSADIHEKEAYPSKVPDVVEEQSTPRSDTDSVTKLVVPETFETTEKQYVTKSDDDEISKISETPEQHGTSLSDIESVTQLIDTEPSSTEKQYETKLDQEDVPTISQVIEEQSTSRIDTEAITEPKYSDLPTTEKQSDQEEIHEILEPNEEQGTSQIGDDTSTKEDDIKSYTTEKQYDNKTEKEETEKIPVFVDEQSTPQSDIESATKFGEAERDTTEKQYVSETDHKYSEVMDEHTTSPNQIVTQSEDFVQITTEKEYVTSAKQEIPKIVEENEKQSTPQIDIEIVTKLEYPDLDSVTTEKTHEIKYDQEDVSKSPEIIEEHGTSHFDSDSVTKLEDNDAFTTEKQYITKSDLGETSVVIQEQSTEASRIGSETETKVEDIGASTTEKQDVTKIYIEDTPSDKAETNVYEKDIMETEKTTSLPVISIDTTVKSDMPAFDLHKPLEEVTEVSTKDESSTKGIPADVTVSTSVSENVEATTKLMMPDAVNVDNVENYNTERDSEVSSFTEEVVTVKELENKTPSKTETEEEITYSETTPYSVLLEEHTHSVLEDTSSDIVIEELPTTVRIEKQPERGDQIPETYDNNDEYGNSTEKPIEQEVITQSYEKITSPDVETVTSADDVEISTIAEKVPPIADDQYGDKKYTSSIPEQKITTPIPTIKEEEQGTTVSSSSDKEFTTLRDIIYSSERPEITASPSKDEGDEDVYQ
ncbi:hypothetical protein KGM_206064 [Danaus plexippus plexippus]|uniref:VWFC domain-containing protein n=1 Tax=Danaus plexippus plexippus TaxID=278856 RepID=A0A212EJN0_DANPL|nr:hypothetical protein KGM_206064 [Danaus plexippus plexippus]